MYQFLKFISFGITLYLFRKVSPSGSSICLTYTCCCMYSL